MCNCNTTRLHVQLRCVARAAATLRMCDSILGRVACSLTGPPHAGQLNKALLAMSQADDEIELVAVYCLLYAQCWT